MLASRRVSLAADVTSALFPENASHAYRSLTRIVLAISNALLMSGSVCRVILGLEIFEISWTSTLTARLRLEKKTSSQLSNHWIVERAWPRSQGESPGRFALSAAVAALTLSKSSFLFAISNYIRVNWVRGVHNMNGLTGLGGRGGWGGASRQVPDRELNG